MKLPPLKDPTRGERWWVAVRTAPVCMREVTVDAVLSYPIPGEASLHFFHTLPPRGGEGTLKIVSRLTARLPELRIIEFHQPPEVLFPGLPDEVHAQSPGYDSEVRSALLEVIPMLAGRYPTEPSGALGPQFVEALEALVAPELMPYYLALNPHFFKWCAT